jgi:hypothetical protein
VHPADLLDLERHDMIGVALHDPLESVADPDHLDTFEASADRRGADDAVDTGGWAPTDENG